MLNVDIEKALDDAVKSNYGYLPPWFIKEIHTWVFTGRMSQEPFIQAILRNDLSATFLFADNYTIDSLKSMVKYIYNQVPTGAWGSIEKLAQWKKSHDQSYKSTTGGVEL